MLCKHFFAWVRAKSRGFAPVSCVYCKPGLRARAHYVMFGLTRLRFSKFPRQRWKMTNTRRQMQSRQRRGGACVDAVASAFFFAFFVAWLPRPPFVDSSFGGKRLMSNHSHRRDSSAGDKVLSLSREIVHFAFKDFAVDSCHPLSAVQSTTIEVAWNYVVFDAMLSLSAHCSRTFFSISLVLFSSCTEEC